jgi:hypothetical protein
MAFDGYAGFRMGCEYQLRYTREFDEVRIALDHASQLGCELLYSGYLSSRTGLRAFA